MCFLFACIILKLDLSKSIPCSIAFCNSIFAGKTSESNLIQSEVQCIAPKENGREHAVELSPSVVVLGADYDVSSRAAATVFALAATGAAADPNSRLQLRHVQNCNERRRHFEDNLAAIFMGFVIGTAQ